MSSDSLTYLQLTANSLEIRDGCRTISLRSISPANSDETIEVPHVLNSIQSLLFCGFSHGAATQIYNQWTLMERDLTPHDLGYGQHFVELARDYISHRAGIRNAFVEGDDWVGALQFMGVKSETRNAIINICTCLLPLRNGCLAP